MLVVYADNKIADKTAQSHTVFKKKRQDLSHDIEQSQQNRCARSEDSDQPGHPPSLVRVFAVRSEDN